MKVEEVIERLRVSLKVKIARMKKDFERDSIYFSNDEDYLVFKEIFDKTSYTNEDINDLLIYHSDSVLSDEEILEFVFKRSEVIFDNNRLYFDFNLRNIILYYLLTFNNWDLVIRTLKCFDCQFFNIKRSSTLESLYQIDIDYTMYDLYLAFLELDKVEDVQLKKKKSIVLMSYLDTEFLSSDFKKIDITINDLEDILKDCDEKAPITLEEAYRLLNGYLKFKKIKIGDDKLDEKVLNAYQNYCASNLAVLDSDFIDYYNTTYGDDFSSFYYNVSEKTLLNADLLYSIIKRYSMPSCGYKTNYIGEYAGKYQMFSEYNEKRKEVVQQLTDSNKTKYECILSIRNKYAEVFDSLEQSLNFSLSYFIYSNVLREDYEIAMEIVAWYKKNQASKLGKNITATKEQKENVKKDLLDKCKSEVFADFVNRDSVISKYKGIVEMHLGKSAIIKSTWSKHLASFEKEYYAKEGIQFIKILIATFSNGESVLEKVRELDIQRYFDSFTLAICEIYPKFSNATTLVRDAYYSELKKEFDKKRALKEKEEADRCSSIISRFLLLDYKSKETFLASEGLTNSEFDYILANVQEHDFPLYVEFMNRFSSLKNQRYLLLMKTVDYVLNGLVNGIVDNGVIRPFDYMDYCLITKLDFDKFTSLAYNAGKINATNVRQFREFERKVKAYKRFSFQHIMDDKHILPVNGVLHEVTEEEKKMALRFLRIKGLDNYYVLYKKALSMVLSGELTQEKLDIMDESGKKAKALA